MRYSADAPFPSLSWSVFSGEPHCLCFSSFFVSSAFFSLSPITWRTFVAKYVSMQRLYRRLYHKRRLFFLILFPEAKKIPAIIFRAYTLTEFWSLIFMPFFPDSMFFLSFFLVELLVFFFLRAKIEIMLFFFFSICWELDQAAETLVLTLRPCCWEHDQAGDSLIKFLRPWTSGWNLDHAAETLINL